MASPPTSLTQNAATPLSSEDLAADRAASAQTTDPLDKPETGDTSRPASESGMAGGGQKELEDREQTALDTSLTQLPPG